MSGAQEAAQTLRTAALARHEAVRQAVTAYGTAVRTFLDASTPEGDLMDALQAAPGVILAAEALAEAAAGVEKDARAVLAEQMMETGATTFRTEFHTITVATAPRRVCVVDASKVPVGFTYQPPRKPDEKAISSALRDGEPVAGCELTNGGPPQLRISKRTKKEAA